MSEHQLRLSDEPSYYLLHSGDGTTHLAVAEAGPNDGDRICSARLRNPVGAHGIVPPTHPVTCTECHENATKETT